MTTNGVYTNGTLKPTTTPTPILDTPPGLPGKAYTLPSLSGEIIYIPCSKSATRLLVTGAETSNTFAVVGSGGTHSPPIGFHYHNEAHDVFLCLKGQINVWADDKCRTMSPGDFASVPPGTIHQYQILGTHTEFLGLIVPGGWEEFFRFIGEPYTSGPLFPTHDDRNPFEVLIPKLKAAAEKFDMVPCPTHPQVDPQPWGVSPTDSTLPGSPSPYFLRHNTGPAYLAGPTLARPLATTAESNSRFSVVSLEGSSHPSYSSSSSSSSSSSTNPLTNSNSRGLRFSSTHHCFQVSDGQVKFSISGASSTLNVGDTVYVPAGTVFKFEWASRVAKLYVFANGGGVGEALVRVGKRYEGVVLPERPGEGWELGRWGEEVQLEFGFEVVL